MLKNLKIRTGLLAVLTLFVVALAGATSMGWLFAKAADEAVDDLNRVSTEQTRPLYETQVLLLRTRITLVAAYLDVQAGRGAQAQASVDQAAKISERGAPALWRLPTRAQIVGSRPQTGGGSGWHVQCLCAQH